MSAGAPIPAEIADLAARDGPSDPPRTTVSSCYPRGRMGSEMGDGRRYRQHQRFMVDLEATVTSTRRSLSVSGRVLDLGAGGAACELEAPLRMAEPVVVHFQGCADLSIRATVLWVSWFESSGVRVGLRFVPEDEERVVTLLGVLGVQADVGSE